MIGALLGLNKLYLVGLVVAIALGLVAYGWTGANKARALKDAKNHIETLERINDAIADPRTIPDIRDRLRDLAK